MGAVAGSANSEDLSGPKPACGRCQTCCDPGGFETVEMDAGKSMALAQAEDAPGGGGDVLTLAEGIGEEPCHFTMEVLELNSLPAGGVNGKRPPYRFRSGSVYRGQWDGNKRHGYGAQQWPDGTRYEGEWSNNSADGRGRFTFDDGDVYIGFWLRNKFHGFGSYYNMNKLVYVGEWVQGRRQGFGVEVGSSLQPDVEYLGSFSRGHKDGRGVCRWPDGSEYRGEWRSNMITGFGAYYSPQGERNYKGQWCESAKHGQGCYEWPDGRTYRGQYDRDLAAGFGVFRWPDGSRYEGYWRSAKQHGFGRYVAADGSTKSLQWWEGRPIQDPLAADDNVAPEKSPA